MIYIAIVCYFAIFLAWVVYIYAILSGFIRRGFLFYYWNAVKLKSILEIV
jgi:hypothetical protein